MLTIDHSTLFEQIAPRWSKRLKHFPPRLISADNISWGLQIIFADTCVVGEAHGYTGDYLDECPECSEIGHEFVRSYFARSLYRMKANIELFASHWNACHLKKKDEDTNFIEDKKPNPSC